MNFQLFTEIAFSNTRKNSMHRLHMFQESIHIQANIDLNEQKLHESGKYNNDTYVNLHVFVFDGICVIRKLEKE